MEDAAEWIKLYANQQQLNDILDQDDRSKTL